MLSTKLNYIFQNKNNRPSVFSLPFTAMTISYKRFYIFLCENILVDRIGCVCGGGGASKQGDTIAQSICKDALDDKVKVESTI